jgi:hypothetical protein
LVALETTIGVSIFGPVIVMVSAGGFGGGAFGLGVGDGLALAAMAGTNVANAVAKTAATMNRANVPKARGVTKTTPRACGGASRTVERSARRTVHG